MNGAAPDVATLVPQAGQARLVESVLELREEGIDCGGRIPVAHPLVREGSAPAFLGLELAAQAAAVFEALRHGQAEKGAAARVGYLVSARDVRLERAELPAGVALVASVRAVGRAAALSLYEVRVLEGGRLGLQGTIATFVPDAGGPPERGGR